MSTGQFCVQNSTSYILFYITFSLFKDTSWGKKQQNLQLPDILAIQLIHIYCLRKPLFKTLTQTYLPNGPDLKKMTYINRAIDQNIQKLLIFGVFASYIASTLKALNK